MVEINIRTKIVYLRDYEKEPYNSIAEQTNYKPSTVKSYYYKAKKDRDIISELKEYLENVTGEELLDTYKELLNSAVPDPIPQTYDFCVYVINGLDDNDDFMMSKVGYTNNFNRRYKELLRANKWSNIDTLNIFHFDEEEVARQFECIARKYFRNLYGDENWKRNDRFLRQINSEDLTDLNEQLEKFKQFCEETA